MSDMIYCRACGTQMHISATACPKCGAVQQTASVGEKKILIAFLLCLFCLHRFYVGKIGTAILQIISVFCIVGTIWWLVDLIMIVAGAFKDSSGKKLTNWT